MENKIMNENELQNIAGGAEIQSNYYIVKSGDTLGAIANAYYTTVAKLLALNPRITNANLIYPGEAIRIR